MPYERFDVDRAREREDLRVSAAICRALLVAKGNLHTAVALAGGRMRDAFVGRDVENMFLTATDMSLLQKADVGATADPSLTSPTAALMRRVVGDSALAQLPRARRVPFRSSGRAALVASGGGWVTPGQAIPIVRSEFAGIAHAPKKIAGIAVFTNEAIGNVDNSDESFADELTRKLVANIDAAVTGSGAATAAEPAGLAFGASTVASSGATLAAIAKDVSDAVRIIAAGGYLADTLLLSAAAATFIRGQLNDQNSQTYAGLRIITTASTVGITVLASEAFALTLGALALDVSVDGLLEMSDAPTADSTVPTAPTTKLVDLFGTDSQALRAVMSVNFSNAAPSTTAGNVAAVSITGASYD